jgi:hypothetical protein
MPPKGQATGRCGRKWPTVFPAPHECQTFLGERRGEGTVAERAGRVTPVASNVRWIFPEQTGAPPGTAMQPTAVLAHGSEAQADVSVAVTGGR